MTWELAVAGFMFLSLAVYALTGGADFGGGTWELFATGPRKAAQRRLITEAIGPIWEANHVWLIVVIVLLFVAFPVAFATVTIALHIPLVLLLIGIVLRGSAFVFRSYGRDDAKDKQLWGRIFALSSAFTPVMLGVTFGAMASGSIVRDAETGRVVTNYLSEWLAPFPFAVGVFTLALFAMLAAIYLSVEAEDDALRDDFRARGIVAAIAVGALAYLSLALARSGAPLIFEGLTSEPWSIPFHVVTGVSALATIALLWKRKMRYAQLTAGLQVVLILGGWAAAQYPYLVPPELTYQDGTAPVSVLKPLVYALVAGLLLVGPAFGYLYWVFKGPSQLPGTQAAEESGS